jgi:hypothetical protein
MCKVTGALSSLIIFHHGPTAAKLSSLRMLETDTFIIERAQAHEAHANKPPVPAYDRPHLRGPWSRLVGGWCEAEEKKRKEGREGGERDIYKPGRCHSHFLIGTILPTLLPCYLAII